MAQKAKTRSRANNMWGGHYKRGPGALMARINECLDADKRLTKQDIAASKAHAAMLAAQKIITAADNAKIQKGLDQISQEIETGRFTFRPELEDIHMNVESRLKELIGDAAGRLHTARSRNDQVAVDLRLWIRDAAEALDSKLKELQKALLAQAEKHARLIMPGFTHLQPAQPVTFGHHMLAYVEMCARDRARFQNARQLMNECPLGAAALAGTSFPIDRFRTAKSLGFDAPCANSIDAVSDRDFMLEFASSAAIAAMHLSRLAEEIVLWASDAFRYIKLSEAFTTGSSIMPQKRNPDAAELIRAKAAGILGAQTQLMALMKGLPLAYNKDLQETKLPAFRIADELGLMLEVAAGMIRDMQPCKEILKAATQNGFLTATDLADHLVKVVGLPFREAHQVTGKIVRLAEQKRCRIDELELSQLQTVFPRLRRDVFDVLTVEKAVDSRASYGGTAPAQVLVQIRKWKKLLAK